MRITIVTKSLLGCGGSEYNVLRLAKHFDATVHCLAYDEERTFTEFRGLDVRTPPAEKRKEFMSGSEMVRPMKAPRHFYGLKLEDYDVISAHLPPSEFIRHRNSPVVWYCYSPNRTYYDLYDKNKGRMALHQRAAMWLAGSAYRHFEGNVVRDIEHIFTNSRNSQERIKRYLKRDSEILYSGIDAGRFRDRGQERYFFYPSRISPEKDFEFAIEAFRIFSRMEGGWKLVIAGSLHDLPEKHAYLKRLRSLCDDSIKIETDVSGERLADLYSRCHAVLYSPINEDFGNIPLEAMASSKPCIAKNEGGPRETVLEGVDGFLVNSPQEMAERMRLLAKDPELCAAMGRAGRKKVAANYRWEKFLSRFEGKFREIADRPE